MKGVREARNRRACRGHGGKWNGFDNVASWVVSGIALPLRSHIFAWDWRKEHSRTSGQGRGCGCRRRGLLGVGRRATGKPLRGMFGTRPPSGACCRLPSQAYSTLDIKLTPVASRSRPPPYVAPPPVRRTSAATPSLPRLLPRRTIPSPSVRVVPLSSPASYNPPPPNPAHLLPRRVVHHSFALAPLLEVPPARLDNHAGVLAWVDGVCIQEACSVGDNAGPR